jgi:DNA primase
VQRIAPLFQQIPDRIVQGHYINQLAKRLDLDERLVLSEIRRARLKTTPKGPASQQPVKPARQSTEDHLFALLLRHRDLTHEVAMRVPADDLGDTRNRELLRYIVDPELAGLTPEQLIAGLDDELADHAEATLAAHEGRPEQFPGQIQREANEVLDRLRAERYRFLLRQLQQHLLAAEQEKDREMVDALRQQLNTLAQRHAQYDPPLSPYFKDLRTPQHG